MTVLETRTNTAIQSINRKLRDQHTVEMEQAIQSHLRVNQKNVGADILQKSIGYYIESLTWKYM